MNSDPSPHCGPHEQRSISLSFPISLVAKHSDISIALATERGDAATSIPRFHKKIGIPLVLLLRDKLDYAYLYLYFTTVRLICLCASYDAEAG